MSQVPPHLQTQVSAAGNSQSNSDPLFEQRVAALQRRERELQKREQNLNGAMTQEQMKEAIKKDKAGFLKGLGIELPVDPNEDVPDYVKEFRQLKAERDAEKAAQEDREYRESILGNVKGNDKYELLNSLGDYDNVLNYIKELRDSGQEFDPYAIFDQAEQSTYAQLEKVKSAKKLSPWFEPKAPAQPENVQRGYQPHPLDASRTMTSQERPSQSTPSQATGLLPKNESLRQLAQKYSTPKQGQ